LEVLTENFEIRVVCRCRGHHPCQLRIVVQHHDADLDHTRLHSGINRDNRDHYREGGDDHHPHLDGRRF
jgi:hypothetical protein